MTNILVLLLVVMSTIGFANEDTNRNKPDHPRMGPPPKEAIDICLKKKEESSCKMTTPRGDTLTGTCRTTPDKKYFVCAPNRNER